MGKHSHHKNDKNDKKEKKEKKKPCLRTCQKSGVSVNHIVYVDQKFGSNLGGKHNSLSCPYKTINGAIASLVGEPKSALKRWIIIISPGIYNEMVVVPAFINLKGSGFNTTFIKSLKITGSSTVSGLTIAGTSFPLLVTELNSAQPDQNKVVLEQIRVLAESILDTLGNPMVSIGGSGLNNAVTLVESSLNLAVSKNNPVTSKQVLFGVTATLQLSNVLVNALVNFNAPGSLFLVDGGQVAIEGGQFALNINEGPEEEMNLFEVLGGNLRVLSNMATMIVFIIKESYKADVSYLKSDKASTVSITNSTANLDGVSVDFLNLVNNLNPNATINLLQLATPFISAPRIKGFREGVAYVISSGNGDLVANGGLYANIVTATAEENPEGYFLQENDYTVLAEVNVFLFDPKLADEQVTDKGKIINIKNISDGSIEISSQNDSIYGGNITLLSSESATFQNDGKLWYRI